MESQFGELVRRHREVAGLSQNALARLVEVDQSYINRLERGEREPPKRALVARLAEALALTGVERQRLLLAAGHVPDWLLALEPDDETLLQVATFLAAPDVSAAARQEFRQAIALILRRWRLSD